MKTRILGILGAIALLLSAGSVYAGDAKPVKYHASGGCTFINTGITFDGGVNYASESTCTGSDNFGLFQSQLISASFDTGTSCTAPDGSTGELYMHEFGTYTKTYTLFNDQWWADSFIGTFCVNYTTNVFGATNTWDVLGGTGRFTGATGTTDDKATGSFLYLAVPPLQTGYFARDTFTSTGTITP